VRVTEGRFYVELGSGSPLTGVSFDTPYFLGITVNAGIELPRIPLTASAYSLNARRVETVDNATGGTITGNIDLEESTVSAGNILKSGAPFIHDFGLYSVYFGVNSGNLTMTGGYNTGIGYLALTSNTTGSNNTACGEVALQRNTTGYQNTACGAGALYSDTSGHDNTATGKNALFSNRSGNYNTACGKDALDGNITGNNNTAVGYGADVATNALSNATAIGNGAIVDASNKIRLGDDNVTVICGKVAFTVCSDRNEKENFQAVDGNEVLRKIRGLSLTSWNYKGNDPQQFRHYGPVAQEFFAAFGRDGLGTCGDSVTINSGDMAGIMMIAIQTLEKRTAENAGLKARIERLERLIESGQADRTSSAR
jgi:trimeric autotransporter adhesin